MVATYKYVRLTYVLGWSMFFSLFDIVAFHCCSPIRLTNSWGHRQLIIFVISCFSTMPILLPNRKYAEQRISIRAGYGGIHHGRNSVKLLFSGWIFGDISIIWQELTDLSRHLSQYSECALLCKFQPIPDYLSPIWFPNDLLWCRMEVETTAEVDCVEIGIAPHHLISASTSWC